MSTALALAGVTAVLKNMLSSVMVDQQVTTAVGQGVTISAVAPDAIDLTGTNAKPQINLFLHQVTPNAAWRNTDLPSVDVRGNRVKNQPLALDLHYLLTAYGTADMEAEVLLGYAALMLHQAPVLARGDIQAALVPPNPPNNNPVYQALGNTGLAEQLEQLKIIPSPLGAEEMSRLWTALQAHYRPTLSFQVSVVLMRPEFQVASALPVLKPNITAATGLQSPLPGISAAAPPASKAAVQLGDTVTVTGTRLAGSPQSVSLSSAAMDVSFPSIPVSAGGDDSVQFTLPNQPANLPAGVYLLAVNTQWPTESFSRTTNSLPLAVAPEITNLPSPVTRDGSGTAIVAVSFSPAIRRGQEVSLILGSQESPAPEFTGTVTTLQFTFPSIAPATYLARLRVDGIESPVMDASVTPPVFSAPQVVIQ